MMDRRWFGLVSMAAVLVVGIGGCAKSYSPEVALPASEEALDAVVEFHPLQATRSLQSGHETFGVLADNTKTPPPSELATRLSAALEDAFSSDRVFRRFSRFEPAPDLLLTGRIDRFYEHDRPRLWSYMSSYIPYADVVLSLFRMNTHVSSGTVSLTMYLLKPTGEVVGRYHGQASFDETYRPHADIAPGDRLNRAFSEALQQIRDKMMADRKLQKTQTSRGLPRA